MTTKVGMKTSKLSVAKSPPSAKPYAQGAQSTKTFKAPKTGMQGDKAVTVPKMKSKGSRNSVRNTYPADNGKGFTGKPHPESNENLKTKKDVVKVIVWNPSKTLKKTGKVSIKTKPGK